MPHPSKLRLILAFAALYLFWGGTFLFIRFGIETIPPFLMAGARHLVAGLILYVWAQMRAASRGEARERPTARHWLSAFALGALMLVGGNGGVTWAEQRVASGLAALMIATMPMWLVLIDWMWHGAARPTWRVTIGIVVGFAGVVILVGPGRLAGADRVDPVGAVVLTLAAILWAIGALYSRSAPLPKNLLLVIAMQSVAGGVLLFAVSAAAGEWARFSFAAVTLKSALSVAYLTVFGSIIGFTAFIWLMRVTTPARVSTYSYVNPIVALLFGWLAGGEPLPARTLIAAATIVVAVILIVSQPVKTAKPPCETELLERAEAA